MRGKRSSILLYFDNYHRVADFRTNSWAFSSGPSWSAASGSPAARTASPALRAATPRCRKRPRWPSCSWRTPSAGTRRPTPKSAPTIKMQPGAGRRGAGRPAPRQRRPNQGRRRRLSRPSRHPAAAGGAHPGGPGLSRKGAKPCRAGDSLRAFSGPWLPAARFLPCTQRFDSFHAHTRRRVSGARRRWREAPRDFDSWRGPPKAVLSLVIRLWALRSQRRPFAGRQALPGPGVPRE